MNITNKEGLYFELHCDYGDIGRCDSNHVEMKTTESVLSMNNV